MNAIHHDDSAISQAVRDLEVVLEDRGIVSGRDIDASIDRFLASARPLNGARIVASAWVDIEFRERLLADAGAAIDDFGFDLTGAAPIERLRVVANSRTTHHVLVCTLCSCYPVALLGPSPSWYKSEAYRARVVREPRGVLAEFGLRLSDDLSVRVWDTTAETRYMVLPLRPPGTGHLSEDELARLVTRNGLVGTAAV